MTLDEKLSQLPTKPGVYLMRDSGGNIIYIGKARVLKNRVSQYFRSSAKPVKVQAMVDNIADLDYIITLTEKDALALEANLIRKYKPRYNILLKDDKSSPYIKIDLREDYPRLEVTRKVKRDGARYFGPFFNGIRVNDVVDVLRHAYKIRTCNVKPSRAKRACLNYHIGLCDAPCVDNVDKTLYRERLNKAIKFLHGNDEQAEATLRERMERFAVLEQFEQAISCRNQLETLKKLKERTIASLGAITDIDAFAVADSGEYSSVSVVIVRGNKLMGVKNYRITDASLSMGETLSAFLTQYYTPITEVPQEICLFEEFDVSAVEEYLASLGKPPLITFPQKGAKARLVKMAQQNASDFLVKSVEKIKREEDMTIGAVRLLEKTLKIKSARRIECYDISHISGTDKVASQSVFLDGKRAPEEYRKYRIKTVEGSDDFACMQEVIKRRLSEAKTNEKFEYLPDLIVIDGGKGQLSSAYDVMMSLGYNISMVGLAKRDEEIFTPHSSQPIVLTKDNYALRLLQRVRDEAHRFGVTYHRNLRAKRYGSELENIKGVGEKKRAILLKTFGSIEQIKQASLGTIQSVEGIDKRTAQLVYDYFNTMEKSIDF